MSTVTIKGHLIGYHFKHMANTAPLYWSFSTSFRGYFDEETIAAVPHEFTAEVPDINVVAAKVKGLEAAKAQALVDYQLTVRDINERLSKLQAITNEVPA